MEILALSRSRLFARHPALKREAATARQIEEALRAPSGVKEVTISVAGATLEVRFDPAQASGPALLRLVETTLLELPDRPEAPNAENPSFAAAHLALGVSAVGEFVAEIVLPGAAALLVWNNVGTLRAGTEQIREGKLGLPVLYSAIVGSTLLSGSLFSAALMFWFFRYWERQYRNDMAEENAALLGEVHAVPPQARVVTDDGREQLAPSSQVDVDQRLLVLAGETIPVDAKVVSGAALVNEILPDGDLGRVARMPGDEVLAGSPVLAGRIELAALRSGRRTRAARLAHAMLSATVPAPSSFTLTREAEAFGDRAVPPTLVAAAVGLFAGGAPMAGAILRPDFATGIGLTADLNELRVNRVAMRHGALVHTRGALDRLGASAWVVLDDCDWLAETECELAEFRVRGIGEEQLLPALAAAGAWLGDARGRAIAHACAARGLVARRAALHDIDEAGVAIDYGRHVVRLRGCGDRADLPPLRVDVDGVEAAYLRFRRNGRSPAAATVRQLQRSGLRVFLASGRLPTDAARVARQLGVDQHAGSVDNHAKCGLLHKLQESGAVVMHVRDGPALPYAWSNYVSVAPAGAEGIQHDADIALFSRSIQALPGLVALGRDNAAQRRADRWTVIVPKVLAAVGVFAFGFTGLTVVMISNLATYIAYSRAQRALAAARDNSSFDPNLTSFACGSEDLAPDPAADLTPEEMRAYA